MAGVDVAQASPCGEGRPGSWNFCYYCYCYYDSRCCGNVSADSVVIQSPLARKPSGSDVRTCRKQSDIPCLGGKYALVVVSRHNSLHVSLNVIKKE